MYCYESIFSGIRWWEIVNVVGLFASLSYDEHV